MTWERSGLQVLGFRIIYPGIMYILKDSIFIFNSERKNIPYFHDLKKHWFAAFIKTTNTYFSAFAYFTYQYLWILFKFSFDSGLGEYSNMPPKCEYSCFHLCDTW